MALLWPEASTQRAHAALRNALHELRKAFGAALITTAGQHLVGLDANFVACDLHALERDLEAGRVRDAMDAHAELLSGFHVADAPAFDEWLERARSAVRSQLTEAALIAADQLHARGEAAVAFDLLRRAQLVDPRDARIAQRLAHWSASDPVPVRGPTASASDAEYVTYVRGLYFSLRAVPGGHEDELRRSADFFREALVRDPESALAHAGLSNFHAIGAIRGYLAPFREQFDEALRLARRAAVLDPSLAIAHVHQGVQAMYIDSDWVAAGREFGRAVRVEPRYAETHRFYGIFLDTSGRHDEAVTHFREAVRLEPHIALYRNALAASLSTGGQQDEAIAELQRALVLDPAYGVARDRLVRACERTGRLTEAVAVRRGGGPALRAAEFADALTAGGADGYERLRLEDLLARVERLEARVSDLSELTPAELFNPPEVTIAAGLAELGELSRAMAWVERGCAHRPGRLHWFLTVPELEPLHGTARWQALARVAGVETQRRTWRADLPVSSPRTTHSVSAG